MYLHSPEFVMMGGLLCMALFAAVRFLLKNEASRAVSLWCQAGTLLGASLLLEGLGRHLLSERLAEIVADWAMLLALGGLLGLALALLQALTRPIKMMQAVAAFGLWALSFGMCRLLFKNEGPCFVWWAGAIACVFMGMAWSARGMYRHQGTGVASSMAWMGISAALAWGFAAFSGLVSWLMAQGGWPNDPLWMLLTAVSALAVIVGNLGFVGLFLEKRQRQVVQLSAQLVHQEQAIRWHEQSAQWDRKYGLGGVAASLAHELSQPLTNLYLITDRLEMELQDTNDLTLRQCIQDLQSNTQKAGDMLGRIRSFVRSRDRRFEPVQLGQVIEDLQRLIRHLPLSEGLQMQVSMPVPSPVVRADSAQLIHLLMNVARNAVEATAGQGSRQLHIRVWQEAQTVHVSLADNGPGMSAEVLQQAGNAFFSTKVGGMGVGLTIAKSMAKHHGGQLRVGAQPGGGACVELQLPALAQGSAQPASQQAMR